MNALKIISTLLGAIAPLMYLHGQAFYYGQISYWGLEEGLFVQSAEQIFMLGYIAYTMLGVPFTIMFSLYLILAAAMLYNVHELSKFMWFQKLEIFFRLKKPNNSEQLGNQVVASAMKVTLKMAFVFIFIALFLILAINISDKATKLGVNSAKAEHIGFLESGEKSTVFTKNSEFNGKIITCNNIFCGFLASKAVLVIPVAEIIKIVHKVPNKLFKADAQKDARPLN